MKTSIIHYFIVLLLGSCTSAVNQAQNASSMVGHWQLELIKDSGNFIPKPSSYSGAYQIQMLFQKDGSLSGTTSRNNVSGNYQVDNESVKINSNHSEIAETDWGTKFLSALPSVSKYEVINDSLKLTYGDNKQLVLMKIP